MKRTLVFAVLVALILGLSGCFLDPASNISPTARFSCASNNLIVSLNGSGSADTDGSIETYDWKFGDGNTGTGIVTTYKYVDAGTYTIRLTVTDNSGAMNSVTATVTVSVAPMPTPTPPDELTLSPPDWIMGTWASNNEAKYPAFTFSLNNVIYRMGELMFLNFKESGYDISEDSSATLYVLTVRVAAAGRSVIVSTYRFERLTDSSLNFSNMSGGLVIGPVILVLQGARPLNNDSPVAAYSATPSSGDAPLTVSFNASDSTDTDGNIVKYTWDLGDGDDAFGVTAQHIYTNEGSYIVQLTVKDNDGATDSVIYTIIVQKAVDPVEPPPLPPARVPPTASFVVIPSLGEAPLRVTVDASASIASDGSIVSYDWDFGDGKEKTGITQHRTYSVVGVYTIMLTVTDDDGATDSTTRTITVTAPVVANVLPVANFTIAPITGEAPLTVNVDASGSYDLDGTIVSYFWSGTMGLSTDG